MIPPTERRKAVERPYRRHGEVHLLTSTTGLGFGVFLSGDSRHTYDTDSEGSALLRV